MSNLPKGWELVQLNDIVKFSNGKGHEQYIDDNGEYIVVNSKFISTNGEVKKYSNENLSPLRSGDITMVMSDIPNGRALAKCFLINEDNKYTLNQRICSLQSKKDNNKFLFYKLNRNKYFMKFNDGVNQTNLRKNEVLECPIELPPLEEQKKIVDILSTVDKKIVFVEENINATEELKKGLMQKLLTEGIGHTEFKDSELGRIPESWEVVQQSEVAIFYNGRAYKLSEWEGVGTPVIRLQNLTGTGTEYYYSTLQLPEHQYCINGDLLYMWSATFGPVWWKGEKAIYHYHIWKITTEENKLDRNFLFYLLDQITVRMKKQSHGSTMIHVTKGGMEKLKIQLPPLEEQKQIAEILSTVDKKIENLKEKKQSFEELKKGLMQKLLTGEVRV